jgi:hypothetical protein
MPIATLFVEGNLESELLNPILQGTPVLRKGGSKNSLKPRARAERQENRVAAGYLRDRDFDFDPPEDLSKPTVDCEDKGFPIGWRWCRHEIENYLIEPAIVSEATRWLVADIEEAIFQAAGKIRSYESARWTIGCVRRVLPPHYELQTRPDGLNDIALPPELNPEWINAWASSSIEAHRSRIVDQTEAPRVLRSLKYFSDRFDEGFIADVANVLIWFSGKDLLAGMADWLAANGFSSPGEFRATVRDWIMKNPERTLELLPEWKSLVQALRA